MSRFSSKEGTGYRMARVRQLSWPVAAAIGSIGRATRKTVRLPIVAMAVVACSDDGGPETAAVPEEATAVITFTQEGVPRIQQIRDNIGDPGQKILFLYPDGRSRLWDADELKNTEFDVSPEMLAEVLERLDDPDFVDAVARMSGATSSEMADFKAKVEDMTQDDFAKEMTKVLEEVRAK